MRWVSALFLLLGSHSASPSYTPVSALRYFPSYATNNASVDWSSALPREGEESWRNEGVENAQIAQEDEGRSYPGLVNFGSNNLNQLASIPSSLYESFAGEASGSRLGSASISPSSIYTGVFDPNNILIHVSQNFVNFAVSTIAWMVFIPLYSGTSTGRGGRSLEGGSWFNWLSEHSEDVPWALRRIADTAEVFYQLRDEL